MDRGTHSVQNNPPTISADDENHLVIYHNRYVCLWGENSDKSIKLSTLILKKSSSWWSKVCSSILKGDTWMIFKISAIDTALEEKAIK